MNAGRCSAEGALSGGVTSGYVNAADGASLWTEMVGNGPALLTIGGIGSGAFADAPIAGMLARRVTVLGFDRRGTGRSTRTEAGDLDILQQVGDALSVLDGHGIVRGTVFSACAGAAIALELLAAAPHRVQRLVIHEPRSEPPDRPSRGNGRIPRRTQVAVPGNLPEVVCQEWAICA
jgi:pimeloyl-ACP methyl ester carboxylesterase